jgi:hypothetical protein
MRDEAEEIADRDGVLKLFQSKTEAADRMLPAVALLREKQPD